MEHSSARWGERHLDRRSVLRMLAAAGAAAGAVGAAPQRSAAVEGSADAALLPRLTRSSSGQVLRGGGPWRAAGANIFQLALNDYPSPHTTSHAEIDQLLDSAVGLACGIVRAHTLGISIGDVRGALVGAVTGTTRPVIQYDPTAWDAIDYAIAGAAARGLYLAVPMTDEWGYYHGGKRHWVHQRLPGTVSLDPAVTTANSPAQRAGEDAFYTDSQVVADFEQYLVDWLTHTNPYTGRAHRDEPAIAVIETGNELWTAPQDAPDWTPRIAAHIKSIAPSVLVADGSAADGVDVATAAWASPDVDVLGVHAYGGSVSPAVITAQAAFAATKGKAYWVGEYAWSAPLAPDLEAAARAAPNVVATAFWSLQDRGDQHDAGAPYGGDDVSLYYPGQDATQCAAVARLQAHATAIAGAPPTPRLSRLARVRARRSHVVAQGSSGHPTGGTGAPNHSVGLEQQPR